jgi:hypothetical protein
MFAVTALLAVLVTVAATNLRDPHDPYRPVTIVAALTTVVLIADVVTGSRLQFGSMLGLSPLIGGRFYGFGNVAFGVFAVCAIFAVIGLAAPLVRQQRRVAAALLVAGLGLVVAIVDGWPSFGADFGGMLAIFLGFGVFALLVSGQRFSITKAALVAVSGIAFTALVAAIDYLRPAESRTHLGDFVEKVLNGDAGGVVQRKLEGTVNSFMDWPFTPVPFLLALLAWVVLDPERFRAHGLSKAFVQTPTLRAGLAGTFIMAVVGALTNDSGVVVAAVMLSLAVPFVVAAVTSPGITPPEAEPVRPQGPMSRSSLSS